MSGLHASATPPLRGHPTGTPTPPGGDRRPRHLNRPRPLVGLRRHPHREGAAWGGPDHQRCNGQHSGERPSQKAPCHRPPRHSPVGHCHRQHRPRPPGGDLGHKRRSNTHPGKSPPRARRPGCRHHRQTVPLPGSMYYHATRSGSCRRRTPRWSSSTKASLRPSSPSRPLRHRSSANFTLAPAKPPRPRTAVKTMPTRHPWHCAPAFAFPQRLAGTHTPKPRWAARTLRHSLRDPKH